MLIINRINCVQKTISLQMCISGHYFRFEMMPPNAQKYLDNAGNSRFPACLKNVLGSHSSESWNPVCS